jgi:hypothetical protein
MSEFKCKTCKFAYRIDYDKIKDGKSGWKWMCKKGFEFGKYSCAGYESSKVTLIQFAGENK